MPRFFVYCKTEFMDVPGISFEYPTEAEDRAFISACFADAQRVGNNPLYDGDGFTEIMDVAGERVKKATFLHIQNN